MPALVAYSWGLSYFDEEQYDKASESFQKALEEDPEFDLAAAALLATPTAAMLSMGTSQIISAASSSGPSSATAGTAVAGTSTAGTATAASATAATVGITPVTGVVAGVAVVGGGAALAGGGGGGSSDPPPPDPPPTDADLTGDWSGTWTNAGGDSGLATFSLTQTDTAITGTVSVTGDDCLTTGNVSGTISGNSATLTIQSGAESVTLIATADTSTNTLTGDWNYAASSLGCEGETGNFTADLTTGSAEIRW
jgi:hypothetical protein